METKKNKINEFIKEILNDPRIPENIGLNRCIQCGNCSASCPAARYTSYRPRIIIQNILSGERSKLLENEDIWLCFSCFSCNLRCPRNNNPAILIHILRKIALEEGYGWENLEKFYLFLESLRDFGLGVTPISLPKTLFQDLGENWNSIRENISQTLKDLKMGPIAPREIPNEAREQIKKILELASINEDIEKIKKMNDNNQKKGDV